MENITFDPFEKIGKQWALISAGNSEKSNTMTISWGGVGVLWGKNVVFTFIRESRFTKEFVDNGETFSMAFLDESYRKALSFCGSKSGRDYDKWKECGLTPVEKEGVIYPKEAELVFLCKKMAAVPVPKDTFIMPDIDPAWYETGDYHTMYVGEIIDVIR